MTAQRHQLSLASLLMLTTVFAVWFSLLQFIGTSLWGWLIAIHISAPISATVVALSLRAWPARHRYTASLATLGLSALPISTAWFFTGVPFLFLFLLTVVVWTIPMTVFYLFGDWLFRENTHSSRVEYSQGRESAL